MKRTTKRYVITTSALNRYGYRVLTQGGDVSRYQNNPILLWMHTRATQNSSGQILPLGRAVDLRLDGDALTCYLEFDETDSFAMQIFYKYENGTLNMLSLGAEPIEFSDNPDLKLPGQVGPTVTKWILLEVSCVDIGANPDAVACQFFSRDGQNITLSLRNQSAFGLSAVNTSSSIVARKAASGISEIILNALNVGKINTSTADAYLKLASDGENHSSIIELISSTPINTDLHEGKVHKSLVPLLSMNWDQLKCYYGDGTKKLREYAPEIYKAKFIEKYGRMPAVLNGKLC